MMDRPRLVALTASAIVLACSFAGCGSYDNGNNNTGGTAGAAAGGSSGTPTTGGTGGSATSGAGGSTAAGSSAGGSSGAGGSGGSATSGSGDQAGSGGGGVGMAGSSAAGASGTSGGSAGSGAQVECTDVQPCGGDVIGAWSAGSCEITVSGMANLVPLGIGCTAAPITGTLAVSGTWTAMAGGMFSDATKTTGEAVMELAPECLMISGFSGTCDRLVFDPLGLTSVACVDNEETEGCTCTATISQSGGMGAISFESSLNGEEGSTGTYTTADNKLVTTAGGIDTEYSYCVAGNILTAKLTTPSPLGTLTGPIMLQKQ